MNREQPPIHIQPPPSIHPVIPVEELRSKYAILQSKRQSCELQHWCISIVTMSLFFSTIALILCGFMIVRPALGTQNFKEAECRVTMTSALGSRECKCGGFSNDDPYCKSEFLCLQVRVTYSSIESASSNHHNPWGVTLDVPDNETDFYEQDIIDNQKNGVLYENELQILSSSPECSYSSCKVDTRQNRLDVQFFKQKRGEIDQRYKCYYNPANHTQVIAERHYKKVDIFHALFWPSATLVISIVSYCLVRRCHREDKRARQMQNELRGIRNVRQANFVSDMKDRNYMQPIQTEWGVIPNGVSFESTNTMTKLTSYNGPCTRG
jgi:hypothetical protein